VKQLFFQFSYQRYDSKFHYVLILQANYLPPHCDTLDGPVVLAAKKALERHNVNLILAWVHIEGEREVKEAFEKAIKVYNDGNKDAKELAEYWFFETVVRIHREGEGRLLLV